MLTRDHAAELSSALEALDALLAIRIEENRPDPRGIAGVVARPVTRHGSDVLPALDFYGTTGPLANAIKQCELDELDALLLLLAVAPEVDSKYTAIYNDLSDRQSAEGLTGEVARKIAAGSLFHRLAVVDRLDASGRLRRAGLIRVATAQEGALAGAVAADPDLVRWLTGQQPHEAEYSIEFPAARLTTVHQMDDLVLPASTRKRLDSLLARIANRKQVVEEWGFGRHHDNASGIVALFHGPPGTGKTMAASVLARAAGLTAFRIDLSSLVSKYIGETEKNLAKVFDVAERTGCMLVFDEADSVFGKRAEVSDARDRYANQEVSYLLQRIESFPGTVVLATNLLGNIDEAFRRRIQVQIEFSVPSVRERQELWTKVVPDDLPVAGNVNLTDLAERFELSGAEIRNAVMDAAYAAAGNGQVVDSEHLVDGVREQYTRSGRSLPTSPR